MRPSKNLEEAYVRMFLELKELKQENKRLRISIDRLLYVQGVRT